MLDASAEPRRGRTRQRARARPGASASKARPDSVGVGRAARDVGVDRHHVVERRHARSRDAERCRLVGNARVAVSTSASTTSTGQTLRSAVTLPVIAQSPSAASTRVRARTCADHREMVVVGDGALDERDVHVLGKVLDVGNRREDDVRHLRPGRAGARPGRGRTCGSPSSRRARPWPGAARRSGIARPRRRVGGPTPARVAPGSGTPVGCGPWSSRATVCALADERAGGARLDALAARRAGRPTHPTACSCR